MLLQAYSQKFWVASRTVPRHVGTSACCTHSNSQANCFNSITQYLIYIIHDSTLGGGASDVD